MSLGIDIEEVDRFKTLIRNKQFLSRVFSDEEAAYCRAKKNQFQHFAVRFAAKEAIWKAMSEVLNKRGVRVTHKEISIKNTMSGKPIVQLPARLSKFKRRIQVSLSHTRSYAVAVAQFQD